MRIAHLGVGWSPDSAGGLNRYLFQLARAQGDDGHDVTVVCEGPVTDRDHPARVIVTSDASAPLPWRLFRYALAARRVARDADVVVAHFALFAITPLLLGWLAGPRFVVQFQGPWADEAAASGQSRGYRLRRVIESTVYRRASLAIVLSESFRAILLNYGVSDARIVTIWPGVATDLFTPARRLEARRNHSLAPEDRLVVCIRRLVPRMGIDILLRAWAVAAPAGARLIIGGEGPARADLESLTTSLGLEKTVTFAGRLGDDALADLYAASDLTVVPTLDLEGFGLVVLESLASGTPVIGSDIGGLGEALRGLPATISVQPGDVSQLSSAILEGLKRAPSLRDIARAGAEEHSWSATALTIDGLLSVPHEKLVAVSPTGEYGGAEHYLLDVLSCLAHQGVNIRLLVYGPGPLAQAARESGLVAVQLPALGRRAPAEMAATLLANRRTLRGATVVITNHPKATFLAFLGGQRSRVVTIVHDPFQASDRFDRIAKMLGGFRVAASQRAAIGYSEQSTEIIEPAVDVVAKRHMATEGDAGCPKFDVVMVARYQTYKGVWDFCELAQLLSQEMPNVRCALIGPDTPAEPALRAQLAAHISAQDLSANVSLEMGLSDSDCARSIAQAGVLVHLAHQESFGIVVLEALALGTPVVAYDTAGPSHICKGGAGRLIPVGDITGVVTAVRELLTQPTTYREQVSKGSERANNFGVTQLSEAWTITLQRVASRAR